MGRFFDPDRGIWRLLGWLGDIILLSMMWFVCSVPLFTIGASTTALYDAAVRGFRYGDRDTFGRFLRTFKKEFKTATLTTLLWGAVLALCYLLLRAYGGAVEITDLSKTVSVAGLLLLAVLLGFPCWAFASLSRFTFSFGGLSATTVKLAVSRFWVTALMGGSVVLSAWLSLRLILPLFLLPCLTVLLWSLLTEPIFQKYM